MSKKILIIFLLLFLTNCSAPGTALLGPVFTGATTGSVSQASLSFGTNQIVRKIHATSKKSKEILKTIENHQVISKLTNSLHFR